MNKRILCWMILFSLGKAQAQLSGERVYIQTDRHIYNSGETIFFKGYITAGYDSILSTHLFVELWDSAFNRLTDFVTPVSEATASGSITVPRAASGKVFLRAYTEQTAIQAEPFQYIRQVVGAAGADNFGERPVFYPEGGQLLMNCLNHVAFKAPTGAAGTIRNSKGEIAGAFNTAKGNTGSFRLRTQPGEIYRCHWNTSAADSVFELPQATTNGIAIHVNYFDDTLYYDLANGGNSDPLLRKPVIQLMIGDHLAYKAALDMTEQEKFSYFIPVGTFRPGPALVKVVDANEKLLASRPVFIPGKLAQQETELEIIKKDLGARGTNEFRFNCSDTSLQFIAISITDEAADQRDLHAGLLQSLLPSGGHSTQQPKDAEEWYKEIDLRLLTSYTPARETGNFKQARVSGKSNFLQLKGKVSSGKKVLAGKEILFMIRSASTGKKIYKVTTDANGDFLVNDLIIFGDAYVYCKLPGKADEELNTEFQLQIPQRDTSAALLNAFKKSVTGLMAKPAAQLKSGTNKVSADTKQDTIIYEERVIVLEEAVVTTNNRKVHEKRLENLEKRYIDGTGFGGYVTQGETIDVMNDPVAGKLTNLFTYIASKMRSLKLMYVRGRPELFYPIRAIAGDTIIRTYYLNNTKIERDMVDMIRLDEVAVVKFVPMLGIEPGLPPAIAIFTKKTGDQGYWEKDAYKGKEYLVKGYPMPVDPPAPDYSNADLKVVKDTRKTLYWMPYARMENGTTMIRFYNTDQAKKIRVKIEGITVNGNIIWFEKEIQ